MCSAQNQPAFTPSFWIAERNGTVPNKSVPCRIWRRGPVSSATFADASSLPVRQLQYSHLDFLEGLPLEVRDQALGDAHDPGHFPDVADRLQRAAEIGAATKAPVIRGGPFFGIARR